MNNLKNVEKLLLNIENLNAEEKKQLQKTIKPYYSINSTAEYMEMYNKMNTKQLFELFNLIGLDALSEDFILKLVDKTKLPVLPYNIDTEFKYYKLIFKDENSVIHFLTNKNFYSDISYIGDINMVLKHRFNNDEHKKVFIVNFMKYKNDILIKAGKYLGHQLYVYPEFKKIIQSIPQEPIIQLMRQQKNSDVLIGLYSILNDESKVEVYNSQWFRDIVDLNYYSNKMNIIEHSPNEVIETIANKMTESQKVRLFDIFNSTKKVIFLKKALDITPSTLLEDELSVKFFFNSIFYLTDNLVNELNEYEDKLIDIINSIPDDLYVELYFKTYMTFKFQSEKFKNIMYTKAKNILDSNQYSIDKISDFILLKGDKLILDLLKNNLSKENLLLLAIRNEYINEYVLELLVSNQNYFKGVEINDVDKFPMPLPKNKPELINKFISISNYLDEKQLKIYFHPMFIQQNQDTKDSYINLVIKNPNLLTSFDNLLFFKEDEIKNILSNIDISELMNIILFKPFKSSNTTKIANILNILKENLSFRIHEMTSFLNDELLISSLISENENRDNYLSKIHLFIKDEDYQLLVSTIDNYKILCKWFIENRSENVKKLALERLIQLYNNNPNFDLYTPTPYFPAEKIEKEEAFFNRLSFDVIINMALICFSYDDKNSTDYTKYINYITKKIDSNINVLFSINVLTRLDELLVYLPDDLQNKIKNYIETNYNTLINKHPVFNQYIITYADKANFITGVNKGLINEANYNYILKLLSKNKHLFNSMNFDLLNPDIMKMGDYFIDKASRHPIISSKLIKIYENDRKKYNIICILSNKIRSENNDIIYDKKIEIIINYLLENDISIDKELNDRVLYNIESYILEQAINKEFNFKNLEVSNYVENKNNILDKKIEICNNLKELKKLIYQRNFGLTEAAVEEFLISYAYNWDSVKDLCDTSLPSEFIKSLLDIKNINDVNAIKNNIKLVKQYTISDFLNIKSIMTSSYNKSIIQDIKLPENIIKRKLEIGGKSIEVGELTAEFGIFIHSTDAYGTMELINNSYFESWNYNSNTKNHGICTSYITNSSYGTPLIKKTGVMFGFTNVDENSIPLYAPYDLYTSNDGYTITSRQKPFLGRLKTMSDYTRHTHNEFSIERRVFDKKGNSSLRQPDCIIIFEDMPESIKENSIKAYEDFKKNGIELQLIYIDRVKNAKKEAIKLAILIDLFEETHNLEILEQIINIYECNLCSCNYLGNEKDNSLRLFDQHELFQTNRISELLFKTADYIENIQDVETRNIMLNNYISILNKEQFKFDLINDFNKKRRCTFTLYNEKLKTRLEILIGTIGKFDINPKSKK